jgi:hypothetical protein
VAVRLNRPVDEIYDRVNPPIMTVTRR